MKKNNKYGLLVFLTFLLVGMALMARAIDDMDEIWNYNFGYNICNGLIPYTDFNCVVTPLSFLISAVFMQIFGNSLFAFRCLSILLLALTFYVLFHVLLRCSKNQVLAFVGASCMLVLCYLVWIYNYNSLNLLLILLALYLELPMEEQKKRLSLWRHIAAGLVYGAMFLAKQSVGGLLLMYNGVFCILCLVNHRETRKYYGLRLGFSLLLPMLFLCYLLITNSFDDFWNYAVAGVGTFTHSITYWQFMNESVICFAIGLFPVVITAISVYVIIKNNARIGRRFHILALIISWLGASVAYPLCDYGHMSIAIVPFVVCGFCCIGQIRMKTWERWICVFVACFVLSAAAVSEIQKLDEYEVCNLPNFEKLPIPDSLQTHIEEIDAFILEQQQKGNDVLIVDSYAAIYYLPLDIYYKDFSLLNVGNVGTQTIGQLLDRENAVYLICKDREGINKQNHFELMDFIAAHYSKIGEVKGYDVYQEK